MALDKLVDSTQLDSDLTTVANAIRARGGTSESLAFPTDFASAIAAIPGGTSAGDVVMDEDGYLVLSNEASDREGLTLVGTAEIQVSTTSTDATEVATIQTGVTINDISKYVLILIRDKAGERNGYFYGYDGLFCPFLTASYTSSAAVSRLGKYRTSNGSRALITTNVGLYVSSISKGGVVTISSRYNDSYGTIDGTFLVNVYIGDEPI